MFGPAVDPMLLDWLEELECASLKGSSLYIKMFLTLTTTGKI